MVVPTTSAIGRPARPTARSGWHEPGERPIRAPRDDPSTGTWPGAALCARIGRRRGARQPVQIQDRPQRVQAGEWTCLRLPGCEGSRPCRALLAEALEGQHRPPVGVLDDHAATAAGDQLVEQLGDGRLGSARISRRSNHDHRVLSRALHQLLDLPAQPASLRSLVADPNQDPLHGIVSIMDLDRHEAPVRLGRDFMARLELSGAGADGAAEDSSQLGLFGRDHRRDGRAMLVPGLLDGVIRLLPAIRELSVKRVGNAVSLARRTDHDRPDRR